MQGMTGMKYSRDTLHWRFIWLIGLSLLTVSCASPLKQVTRQASELSRSEQFTREDLLSSSIGILTATGVKNYRLIIGNSLATALQELDAQWSITPSNQTINLINRADLGMEYSQMLEEYQISSILEKRTLQKISKALDVQYLILPNLLGYDRRTATRISVFGVRFVHTRSSTLRIMAQIWNGQTGDMVWEGSAEVTLANEDIREKLISFDEISLLAWKTLIEKLP